MLKSTLTRDAITNSFGMNCHPLECNYPPCGLAFCRNSNICVLQEVKEKKNVTQAKKYDLEEAPPSGGARSPPGMSTPTVYPLYVTLFEGNVTCTACARL